MEYICQEKYASTLPKCLNFTQIEYKKSKKLPKERLLGDFFLEKKLIVDYKRQ